ncbi:MAG: hypothetical protein JWM24_2084 [Solirubrobacterales bacterium]|nr:hypothetical protein [Solirubrobacterales bacterium]
MGLVCAGLGLLALPGLAMAKSPGLVLSFFELKGTHGYTVEAGELREGDFPPTTAINAKRGDLRASYEVPGELEPGMHAVFGSLGSIAVAFHRDKRSVSRPEKGCRFVEETGAFRGTFSFLGEGGYTEAKATSIPGKVARLSNGLCGFGDDRVNPRVPDFLRASVLAARAPTANGFVEFGASALSIDRQLGFQATLQETLGAMKVSRTASASIADGAGALTPGKRSRPILLEPPPPFEGSARFRDPAGGRPTWTGSLSVSLPGAADVALAGPDFAARLCPNLYLLRECKVPPRNGSRERPQGSGSHSQAFWDARLSWSR